MIKKLIVTLTIAAALTSGSIAMTLNAAGATFPYPIYSKWFSVYGKDKGVEINYAAIGSGGGIRQFSEGVTDFGASDAFMSNADIQKAGGDVLHIPTVMGAIAIVNNAGITDLKLDGLTIAGIFLGDIKNWNDDRIQALNPGTNLPDMPILVVHRSDGSGTTNIFTNYLARVSTAWAAKVGAGKSVAWPAGVGGNGNPGVAGAVKNNNGAIGYVEEAYAEANNLPMASIKNRSGNFVKPSLDAVVAAADKAVSKIPSDFRADINNQPGRASYPICGMTWLLVHRNNSNAEKGAAIKDFLSWALTDGQKYASDLSYAPLPDSLRAKVLKMVGTIE